MQLLRLVLQRQCRWLLRVGLPLQRHRCTWWLCRCRCLHLTLLLPLLLNLLVAGGLDAGPCRHRHFCLGWALALRWRHHQQHVLLLLLLLVQLLGMVVVLLLCQMLVVEGGRVGKVHMGRPLKLHLLPGRPRRRRSGCLLLQLALIVIVGLLAGACAAHGRGELAGRQRQVGAS